MRLTPPLVALALLTGCAAQSAPEAAPALAGPSAAAPVAGSPAVWKSGMVLRGAVTVPAGATVTLDKGAALTADKGASLVVVGTLLAPAGGSIRGSGWDGLTVSKGGSVTASGLTLDGAGITTATGAGAVTLTGGTVTGAATPVSVALGSTLTLVDTKVSKVEGTSEVKGTLVGRGLRYDKGSNSGIVFSGSGSALRLSDSLLFGDGKFNGDMVITDDAGEINVVRSEVRDVHCAFHVVGVGKLELSGLKIHDNAYGFMAYGSAPTVTHHVTNSDVYDNRDYGLFESPGTVQGRIVVDGGYWAKNGSSEAATLTQSTGKIERLRRS